MNQAKPFYYSPIAKTRFAYKLKDRRVMFEFARQPSNEAKMLLRQAGFLWSRERGAWVRFWISKNRDLYRQLLTDLTKEGGNRHV